MITVGVRELKQQASELIHQVRESGQSVQVTYYGKVVAILVPVESAVSVEDEQGAWDQLDSLAAEIEAQWPEDVSAAEAVSEARR